jgi:DNA-binding FadR family transcriptional regulator
VEQAPILPTLREPKLADRLYSAVLERIIAGTYPPGERLPPEAELAAEFGVSRPTVREALARLRDDDLVESRKGSGSWVKRQPHRAVLRYAPVASIGDLQRLLVFRAAVEPKGAALAADRRTPEELAAIDRALAELERQTWAGQVATEADMELHLRIAEASGNRYFAETLALLREQMAFGITLVRSLSLRRPPAWRARVMAEHRAIVEAIRAHDPAAAEAAMLRHVQNTRTRMFEGEIIEDEAGEGR